MLIVEVPLKVRLLPESHPSSAHGVRRKPTAEEHVEYFLGRHICNIIDSRFDLHLADNLANLGHSTKLGRNYTCKFEICTYQPQNRAWDRVHRIRSCVLCGAF